MDDKKTLVINTVSEAAYWKAVKAGKISDKQLYIVDDDNRRRTAVASFDIVDARFKNAVSASKSSLGYDGEYITLFQGGSAVASVDVTDFIKDAVLSAVDVRLEDEKLKFDFYVKDDSTSAVVGVLSAECDFPVDDGISAESKNPVEAGAIYARFAGVDQDVYDVSVQVSSFTNDWKTSVDLSVESLSIQEGALSAWVDALSVKTEKFSNEWKESVDLSVADLSAQEGYLSAWVDTLSVKTEKFSNEWKDYVDDSLSDLSGQAECLSGITDALQPRFFDAVNDYHFDDALENQVKGDYGLVSGVVKAFNEGRNAVLRFGGYNVLVNAIMDKSPAGISGFCGSVITQRQDTAHMGDVEQIRAMFYLKDGLTYLSVCLENDAVYDLSAWVQQLSDETSSFSNEWKASVDLSVENLSSQEGYLSAWVDALSVKTEKFSNEWKDYVDLSAEGLSARLSGLEDKTASFTNDWKAGVDEWIASAETSAQSLSAQLGNISSEYSTFKASVELSAEGLSTRLSGLEDKTASFTNDWKTSVDLSVDGLRPEFFDVTAYGFADQFEDQSVNNEDLVRGVLSTFCAGRNAVVRFGGYEVLVNAIMDKSGAGPSISGFCGMAVTASADMYAGPGSPDEIRAMFYTWNGRTVLKLAMDDDFDRALSAGLKDLQEKVSSFSNGWKDDVDAGLTELSGQAEALSGWAGTLSGETSSFTNDWKASVDLSVEGLSAFAKTLSDNTSSFSNDWKTSVDLSVAGLDGALKGLDYEKDIGLTKVVSRVFQEDGKISVDERTLSVTDVPGLSLTLANLRDDVDENTAGVGECREGINSLGQDVTAINNRFNLYIRLSSVDDSKGPLSYDNKLVTQKHLEMFDNVMTFKGVVSADPNTYLSGEALSDGYKLGDVVFLDISSTEWLLTGERGQGYLNWKWEEIGDQDHHVTKAEFQAFKASAELSVADLSSQAGDLSAWVQRLSDETSSFSNDWKTSVDLSVENLSAQEGALSAWVDGLSGTLFDALSAVDADPLSGLSHGSDYDAVVSAVVAIRDVLKNLRSAMAE